MPELQQLSVKGKQMYTVIISAIIASTLAMINCNRFMEGGGSRSARLLLRAMVFVFTAFLGGIFGGGLALKVGTFFSSVQEETLPAATLVAMRGSDGFTGTFMLGSGTAQSGHSYVFYTKNKDGSMTPVEMTISSVVHIFEDPGLQNTGTWTRSITKSVKPTIFGVDKWFLLYRDSHITREEFHVPVGTVVQNFKVN
jgi:hypothetical protein